MNQYQVRNIDGNIYYKRKKGNKVWKFTTQEDFIKNANKDNVITWLSDIDIEKDLKPQLKNNKTIMKHLKKFENFDNGLIYDNESMARTYRKNNENPAIELEEENHDKNYMVIQNLKNIISNSQEIMDLLDGEMSEWAKDHIATSKDDIEEVFNYLKFGK